MIPRGKLVKNKSKIQKYVLERQRRNGKCRMARVKKKLKSTGYRIYDECQKVQQPGRI